MEEQETQEEQAQPLNMVDRAEAASKALEANLKKLEEQTKRLENLKADSMLRGQSFGGQPQVKPVEETAAQYATRILNNKKGDGV